MSVGKFASRAWLWLLGPAALFAAVVACESTDGLSGGKDDASAADASAADADASSPPRDASPDGDTPCTVPPSDPDFLSDAIEIDTSGPAVCAVRQNGQVVCWGDNAKGQLGSATGDAGLMISTRPVVVSGIPKALHVAMGYEHACAAVTGGAVWCWGNGSKGQTGSDGSLPPPGLNQVITDFAAPLTNVIALSAGSAFTCALTQGGGVQCWGENNLGQLGTKTVTESATPIPVPDLGVSTKIAAGFFHACAFAGSAVRCWGGDQSGELGIPLPDGGSSPPITYAVTAPARMTASSLDTCVIDATGTVVCSGYNTSGQLGATNSMSSITSPFPIPELSTQDVSDIDIGMAHTCGIRKNGTAFCLSRFALAALGRGPVDASTTDNAALPVLGPGAGSALLAPIHSLKVGGKDYETGGHSCAIVKPACAPAGQVYCWGKNENGAVGDGTTTPRDRPVKVLAAR